MIAGVLVELVIVLVVLGLGLWLINQYVPMAPPIKTILNVIVILIVFVWLLKVLGVISTVPLR